METTKTYISGKTHSFSAVAVSDRQQPTCKIFTGASSPLLTKGLKAVLLITHISHTEAPDLKTRVLPLCVNPFLPVKSKIPANQDIVFCTTSVNISKSVYKSYNDAHWAYCSNLKETNKVDCTITPVSVLKQYDVSVNQAKICTLGEVAAMPDFPFETKFLQHAVGKKPVT